jgi:hypothetical protein
MTKEKRQLLGIKKIDKREKQKQIASHHTRLLEDGLTRDGIECIYVMCVSLVVQLSPS